MTFDSSYEPHDEAKPDNSIIPTTLQRLKNPFFGSSWIPHDIEPSIEPIEKTYNIAEVLEIATHAYAHGVEQGLEIDFPSPSDTANFIKYINEYIKNEY